MPEDRHEKLLLYLRQQGDRYSLDALRRQMASEGYEGAEIERAIEAWLAEKTAVEPERKPVWPLALLVALVDLLLSGAAIGFGLSEFGDAAGASLSSVFGVALSLALAGELLGGMILLCFPRHRRLALGLLFGFLLYFGILIVTAGGFCLFLMSMQH